MPTILEPLDEGALAPDVHVVSGALVPDSAGLKRFHHVGRGYDYRDIEVSVRHWTLNTAPWFDYKAGVTARRLDQDNQLAAWVTATQLFVARLDAGVWSPPTTADIDVLAADTDYWVVLRVNGDEVAAEHWTSEPTPGGAPAASVSITLDAASAAKYTRGEAGVYWEPGTNFANARVSDFRARPYTRKSVALPSVVPIDDVPGDAPAEMELEITPEPVSFYPFALVAWAKRARAPAAGALAPIGLLSPVDAVLIDSKWVLEADAGALFGQRLKDATPTFEENYDAYWEIDPASVDPLSEFEDELLVEVWGRVRLHPSLVTPRLAVTLESPESTLVRHAIDLPATGRGFTLPTAAAFRFCKLGTLSIPCGDDIWHLHARGSLGPGTAGNDWGLDYLWLAAQGARANSPVGVANDSNYPRFLATANETTRYFSSDLRGRSKRASQAKPVTASGLGGASTMELEPGDNDLLVKLSDLVPDNPTVEALSEATSHEATVHADITPRSFYARHG